MDGKENSKRQEETSLDGETFGSKGQESLLLNFLLFPILLPGNISQINICMDALQLWEVCPLSLCHRTTENKGILQEVGGRGTRLSLLATEQLAQAPGAHGQAQPYFSQKMELVSSQDTGK